MRSWITFRKRSPSAEHDEQESWIAGQHRQYRHKARFTSAAVRFSQAVLFILLIGWWELAGRNNWIDVLLFSYPSKIGAYLWQSLVSGTLGPHIGITVAETVTGFLLGTLLGAAIAALLWWYPFISRVLDPYLVVMNSMPKVALGPIFIVSFGPGMLSIVVTTLSVTVIITTLVIYNQFREVDPNYVKVVRLFGAPRRQVFRLVILPASFPVIISTLKVNVGLSWVGVIVGEFLVAKSGLGYLIIYGFQVFNFTLVFASLMIIAVIAALMYQAVALLERRLTSGWKER